ncbi:MAG: hypothetical protein BJ554DRAFT_2008 [Olpidium bornovanus]|uniref:Uncharacterized protein n=1 Tax=Olpidium bornovanus TaxID=278681 RepID=A0A8H7ZQN2_9FUNG|nr:MAG: hypothetical protein BJ554DRAFT_2008 [Olpidium bornovanus]
MSSPRSSAPVCHHPTPQHAPEDVDESDRLDQDARDGPPEENEGDAEEEAGGPRRPVLPREDRGRPGDADQERQAREEEGVSQGQQPAVKEEEHAQEHEKQARGHEARADLCSPRERKRVRVRERERPFFFTP